MKLFRTSLVGCYPQPDWLIDRQMPGKRMPPRIRAAFAKLRQWWKGAEMIRAEVNNEPVLGELGYKHK